MSASNTSEWRAAIAAELERVAVIKGQRARFLARKMLAADTAQQDAFLARVQAAYGHAVAQTLHDAFWMVAAETVAHFQQESP